MSFGPTPAIAKARGADFTRPNSSRSGRCAIDAGESGWPSAAPAMVTSGFLRSLRAIGGADDHRGAAVALQAAVEQPERIGDHARGVVVLDGERLVHHHVAVEDRVLARDDGHLGEAAARSCRRAPCGGARPGRRAGPARTCRSAPRTRRPARTPGTAAGASRRAGRSSPCGRPRSARACRRRSPPPSPPSGWRRRRWRRPSG